MLVVRVYDTAISIYFLGESFIMLKCLFKQEQQMQKVFSVSLKQRCNVNKREHENEHFIETHAYVFVSLFTIT